MSDELPKIATSSDCVTEKSPHHDTKKCSTFIYFLGSEQSSGVWDSNTGTLVTI